MIATAAQRCLFAVFLMTMTCSVLSGQNVPTGFAVDTLVSSGLNSPHDFTFLPDGRMLIAERAGSIKLWRPGTGTVTLVGTVPNTQVGSERGLLSITVRGDKLYCFASRTTTNNTVLSRFTLVGSLNAPTSTALSFSASSEYIILNNIPDLASNHNGGTIRFGPDNMLYVTIGDDADCASARLYNDLKGVILRLDLGSLPAGPGGPPPTASLAPADNPFFSSPNAKKKLAIARGLRNPFSMCIDPVKGDLFIGDVGQFQREEIDIWRRSLGQPLVARDYGWPHREGDLPYNGCFGIGSAPANLVAPIDVRTSSGGSRSIMIAGVVRNFGGVYDFGPDYEGHVFHSDYFQGGIERLRKIPGQPWSNAPAVPGQPSATYWGTGFNAATHFDQGPDGAIYFVQHPNPYSTTGGFLKRIRGSGPVYTLAFTGGDGQVCTSGETFGAPLTIRVLDSTASPVVGIDMELSSADGSALVAPSGPWTTDSNGEVTVTVSSTGQGDGPVKLRAFVVGAAPAEANLFGRKLDVVYQPGTPSDQLQVDFHNRSNATNPVLPFLLAASNASQPTFPTIFGTLHVNLITLQDTLILEDSTGLFGNVSAGPAAPLAVPGFSTVYTFPAGAFAGQTVRFQAFVYDPGIFVSQAGAAATNTGFSNPVTITF